MAKVTGKDRAVPDGLLGLSPTYNRQIPRRPFFVRQMSGPYEHEDFVILATDGGAAARLFFVHNKLHGKAHLYRLHTFAVDPKSALARTAIKESDINRPVSGAEWGVGTTLPEGVLQNSEV